MEVIRFVCEASAAGGSGLVNMFFVLSLHPPWGVNISLHNHSQSSCMFPVATLTPTLRGPPLLTAPLGLPLRSDTPVQFAECSLRDSSPLHCLKWPDTSVFTVDIYDRAGTKYILALGLLSSICWATKHNEISFAHWNELKCSSCPVRSTVLTQKQTGHRSRKK